MRAISKSVKKVATRSARRVAAKPLAAKRTVAKSTRLKPATKRSPAGKARANKASKGKAVKPRPKTAAVSSRKAPSKPAATRKSTTGRTSGASTRAASSKRTGAVKAPVVFKKAAPPQPPPQPTYDEAAALKAFEAAHKEFTRGHFAEARSMFRSLVDKYSTVSEVTARARTYLAVADARLRTEMALPRDADSLYDRGVIELNRGEYVAAQELFERALKREPEAAHVHYGLAASRARLGAIDTALKSLQRALDLQPSLRIRAQRDQDLNALRSDPEFEQLVFASRD